MGAAAEERQLIAHGLEHSSRLTVDEFAEDRLTEFIDRVPRAALEQLDLQRI